MRSRDVPAAPKARLKAIQEPVQELIQDPGDRYGKDHEEYTPVVSGNTDGEKHKKGMKAGGAADNLRINKIAVRLLHQEQEKDGAGAKPGSVG